MRVKRLRHPKTGRWYWRGDETIRGVRYRPRGDSKEEVETILDTLRLRARRDKYDLPHDDEPVTLSELVRERVRDLDLRKKNHKRIKVVLEMFRGHFPAAQLVANLTAADALSYKRARVASSKLRANSINRELEAVTAMLRAAGRYFPSLESWKPPAMPYEPVPEAGRERVITRDEEGGLLGELRRDRRPREQLLAWRTRQTVADLWELAPAVGMRRSEMRLMEKSWVDLAGGVVNLPPRIVKTRKAREVPLNEDALDILRRRCAEHPASKYVFTNARGSNVLSEYQLYRALRNAAARAGLSYGRDVEGGFVLHDARHTAVTRMLQGGADLATVGDVVGHTKKTMTLRYGHSTLESKRRAVGLLAKKRKALDKKLTEETEAKAKAKAAE